jgi:hypothetical protein
VTTDRLTVTALTPQDAQDVARRQWATFGLRMGRVIEVRKETDCLGIEGQPGRWRVTAEVELIREGT